jgi:hypothetical protein
VERRGFEPLTSAVQAPARLTGSSLPFLVGDVGVVRDNATQLKFTPGSMGSRIDERGTAVCLAAQPPSGCRSVVYPGRRPRRLLSARL